MGKGNLNPTPLFLQRALILIDGDLSRSERTFLQEKITHDYVPVSMRSFNIVNTQEFFVGQSIIVFRPGTNAWINDLGPHHR